MTTMGSHYNNIESCDACGDDYCVSCNPGYDCQNCSSTLCDDCSKNCDQCDQDYCKSCLKSHECEK